jgi:ribonuclease BN (tRNA processing enzyme)
MSSVNHHSPDRAPTDPPPRRAVTRRRLLGTAAGGAAATAAGRLLGAAPLAFADTAQPVASRGRTRIVVLGSQGGQQITAAAGAGVRAGTSVLIAVDDVVTVVDCGVGSLHRLVEGGYDADRVRNILMTHHHQDHNADLGNFAGFAWCSGRTDDPDRRLDIYGPAGTLRYEQGYKLSARDSIDDQEGDLGQGVPFDEFARWHEFDVPADAGAPIAVFEDDRFDVRAARVYHGGVESVAFRVRTPDVDVVFSGDRGATWQDEFIAFAKGADVLVHEIIDLKLLERLLKTADPKFLEHLADDHSDPETVGTAATGAGVAALVLYHLVPGNPAITERAWQRKVEPYYSGRIVVSKDLMVI